MMEIKEKELDDYKQNLRDKNKELQKVTII